MIINLTYLGILSYLAMVGHISCGGAEIPGFLFYATSLLVAFEIPMGIFYTLTCTQLPVASYPILKVCSLVHYHLY